MADKNPIFYNRELSWLEFDKRCLSEAKDRTIPLFERIKFLSITASNLDEFFMVRIASLTDMVHAGYTKRDIAGMTAGEQLEISAKRADVRIIKHEEGSDPAAVVFDALSSAKSRKTDVVIVDTAGRLHNKKNLMEELKKIDRVIDREFPEAERKNLLVLDATTGQNALTQAELFDEAIDLDGIILTKLDGTAKGGVVFAIKSELDMPVYFVGVGEGIDDLLKFDAQSFIDGIV